MAKRIVALLCLLALAAGCVACGNTAPDSQNPSSTPSDPTEPSHNANPVKPLGQVRYVNPKLSLQDAWEQIAAAYTKKTGVKVTIYPADQAENITPTLFTVEDETQLEEYVDICLDLASSKASHHIQNWSLTLYSGNKMCGLPLEAEGYGLIYNEELLRMAGVTPADITSFAKLKEVVNNIASNPSLKFKPFAGISKGNLSIGLLGAMPGDIRPFVDLFSANVDGDKLISSNNDPVIAVANGEAAFCIDSTTNGEVFSNMSDGNLNMLPLYIGMENESRQGLCVRVENYLCVRSDVEQADIDATLDFLDYLTHPAEDRIPLDLLNVFTPYSTAKYYNSPMEKTLRDHISAAKALTVFSNLAIPKGLTTALNDYAADPTDKNWKKVTKIIA